MATRRYYVHRGIKLHSYSYDFQKATGVIIAIAELDDVVEFFKGIDRGVRHIVLNGQRYTYLAYKWKETR